MVANVRVYDVVLLKIINVRPITQWHKHFVCAQYGRGIARYRFIPESESLSLASWRSQLASRKLVWSDSGSEESETAKSGTDEQEQHTEAV